MFMEDFRLKVLQVRAIEIQNNMKPSYSLASMTLKSWLSIDIHPLGVYWFNVIILNMRPYGMVLLCNTAICFLAIAKILQATFLRYEQILLV